MAHRWVSFLGDVTLGDETLVRFLQQLCGYAITGSTREDAMVFIHGSGENGKGVFVDTITAVMGDYATSTPIETFTLSKYDRHPTEIAHLKGARLVTADETEKGRVWAESRLKQLTGGGRIAARFMHRDFFEYTPEFLLLIVGNHKPRLQSVDHAMRRRVNLINFDFKPRKPNKNLRTDLLEEAPQILRWMIEGCLDWQRHSLVRPDCVKRATDEYFAEEDLIGSWIVEQCKTGPRFSEGAGRLFNKWREFAKATGDDPGNATSFGRELTRRGFPIGRVHGGRKVRQGLALIEPPAEDDPRDPGAW